MAAATVALAIMPTVMDTIDAAMNPKVHKQDDGVFISCGLAKSFGKLADHYKSMDDEMKVMIGTTMAQIKKIPTRHLKGSKAWDKVKECLYNNPCLEPVDREEVQNYDSMTRSANAWFASGITEADKDSPEVLEAENWINKLISDDDVIANLSFDPKMYAKFVSCTGVALNKLETSSFVKREKYYKTVVDIGVLRFPDMDNPFFKVYRLSLKAYRDCTNTLVYEWNKSGIIGEFNSRKFRIRQKFIKEIKHKTKSKAMSMVDSLFD